MKKTFMLYLVSFTIAASVITATAQPPQPGSTMPGQSAQDDRGDDDDDNRGHEMGGMEHHMNMPGKMHMPGGMPDEYMFMSPSSKPHDIGSILYLSQPLNLTPEQVAKLKDLKKNTMKETIKLNADYKISKIDLKSELHADKPNRDTIEKLLTQSNAIKLKLDKLEINSMLNALDILDQKQRESFKSMHMGYR